MKAFPIDFVRQVIEQTLLEQHKLNQDLYYGGKDQVNLFSFYEQLQKDSEVDRYVEIYRDLTEQQNRTGLIMNGTIIAPENPTITNLYNCLIIPMTFTCSFRVRLEDRDNAINTINNLIKELKGRKRDIAELDTGELFMVGTIGESSVGTPSLEDGDYIGGEYFSTDDINEEIYVAINSLANYVNVDLSQDRYFYGSVDDKIQVIKYSEEDDEFYTININSPIELPPEHTSFTKYKLSLSFDSIRCDEPRNLNANEYCVISFGGSATLVNNGVALGNDLIRLGIKKDKIIAKTNINIGDTAYNWLEPLELPSGNNADTQINQLLSNKFITNTHTNGLGLTLQYTFICDFSNTFLRYLFKYARYGTQADGTNLAYSLGFTPNMIFNVREMWCSWGVLECEDFNAKIVESIDIENTESDTLTISLPLQIQGANN